MNQSYEKCDFFVLSQLADETTVDGFPVVYREMREDDHLMFELNTKVWVRFTPEAMLEAMFIAATDEFSISTSHGVVVVVKFYMRRALKPSDRPYP